MKFSVLSAVTAIAATLINCQTSVAQQPDKITFGMPSRSVAASPPRLADEMGFFAKHGVQVTFNYLEATTGSAVALVSNSVNFALTSTFDLLAAASKGQQLVAVTGLYTGLPASLILSKKAADKLGLKPDASTSERLKALDNLLIAGTSRVSNATLAYVGAAAAVGATPRLTYMAVGAMGAALETGAVDGIITTAPYWAFAIENGSGVMWISAPKGELAPQFIPSFGAVTSTRKDYAMANPAVVEKVRRAIDDFSRAIVERPADVKAAMVRLFPEINPKTIDMIFALEGKAFNVRPLTPADITQDIELVRTSGIEMSGIEKVKPEDILAR